MTQNLIDEVPQHLLDFVASEYPEDEWELILYKKIDPEYIKLAKSQYWDMAEEYAIFRDDLASSGLIVCARYSTGWDMSQGNRGVVRLLLGLLGVELPMPS